MNNTWVETTIGTLLNKGAITIQTGPFGSQLHSYDYEPVGVPVILTESIGRRRLITDSVPRVSSVTANRLSRHKLRPGDILFARRGAQATGLSALVEEEHSGWLCGSGAILLRVNDPSIDPSYLSFFLSTDSTIAWLRQHAVGAVMPNLNETVIRGLRIPLPTFKEQRAIAEVLGAFDEKIELNHRMNATLESMAQAVFHQWFLESEESKGWDEKPLDEIANFLNGLALQKFPAEGDDYLPVIKISQLRTNDTKDADKASTNIPPQYIIEDGDILFSWSGSLEVVVWCGGKGALNQHLFKVTSEQYPKWFYYFWTKHHLADFQEIAAGKATTMGHIQRHHLKAAKVLVPSDKELQEMDKILSPLLEKIIVNNLESRTLAGLRDTLLPKLMRGEVRVKDLEKQL